MSSYAISAGMVDQSLAFPHLTPPQIERIRPHGKVRHMRVGEILFEPGDMHVPFFVLLSGGMEILRSDLKGHGLGWLMMKHMIAYAKDKGLKTVHGQVLAENSTMLQMCAELGFHATDDPDERGVKLVTLPLDEVPLLHTSP